MTDRLQLMYMWANIDISNLSFTLIENQETIMININIITSRSIISLYLMLWVGENDNVYQIFFSQKRDNENVNVRIHKN